MDPAFDFFGDPPPWPFSYSVPIVNFAVQSGPSVNMSPPVANATCPAVDLSNSTEPLGSDCAALNSTSSVQIPDEDSLVGYENFLAELPSLEEGHDPFSELPVLEVEKGEGLWNGFTVDSAGVVPPDVSTSSTSSRWQNFVWLIRACHRFSHATAASLRAKVPDANLTDYVIKGVMKKRGKFVCETRIMKKMQLEKKEIIKKVWLGTYKTRAQAARALDVGKYFFNAKETKTFFDPNTETMLSILSAQLLAQPLNELVAEVKQIANHYGKHGTLPKITLHSVPE